MKRGSNDDDDDDDAKIMMMMIMVMVTSMIKVFVWSQIDLLPITLKG